VDLCYRRVGIGDTCLAPVADRSTETLLTIIEACVLHSTTVVSDCWGTTFVCNYGLAHHSISHCVSFVACGCSQIRSDPHGCKSRLTSGLPEKMNLNVINGVKGSLLAWFDDVPELIVKCCLLLFCWTIYYIYLSNWIFS